VAGRKYRIRAILRQYHLDVTGIVYVRRTGGGKPRAGVILRTAFIFARLCCASSCALGRLWIAASYGERKKAKSKCLKLAKAKEKQRKEMTESERKAYQRN